MEFQWSYFKSWKMMLWKCYTQYVSKFAKLSSGHRTGKGQFSFQSQRKAMPKNHLIDYAKAFDYADYSKLCKILKEMGIPDHLTCLLRNLYAGQEAIVRTGHGTTDWFQIGKEVCQGCILSPCLFNLYAEYIMRNAGLEKHKLESGLLGAISKPQICRYHHPYGRKQRSERRKWKSWLKTQHSENEDHGIWSHHFMANRRGKQWKQCQTLFWGAPKSLQMVTAAMKLKDAYSLE